MYLAKDGFVTKFKIKMKDFPTNINKKERQRGSNETFSGYLSHIELTEYDYKLLLSSLRSKYKTYFFDFLTAIISPPEFLKFLDLFSHDILQIPPREEICALISDVKIYGYIERKKEKSNCETLEGLKQTPDFLLQSASMAFALPKLQVEKSNNRTRKLISSLNTLDLLNLNSLKSRKKLSIEKPLKDAILEEESEDLETN